MKLALGSAQFGLSYGVANEVGQVCLDEAKAILDLARRNGVSVIDTAIAYGESEYTLGQCGIDNWSVVSKLPQMPRDVASVEGWVVEQVENSLKRLGVTKLDAVLLHRPDQLFEKNGIALYEALKIIKAKGLTDKIGISIYESDELPSIFENMHFDLVQAPLNIFDQRLLDSGWAKRLKSLQVELHVRSAFLQGLLLMPLDKRPIKFNRWKPVWLEWDRWLIDSGLTPLQACLQYVYQIPEVDHVIVGVDRVSQLQEILSVPNNALLTLPQWSIPLDGDLLNPAKWNAL
jgi:aryl-alcohol dehydrogenase-like predicted oxidoreductase